ncbi:alpha-D-ribose 1-methylphosphonate 5-triphosphate diphosphatase [Bacillaceae bacterium SAS-127]|nr:alpha-D-ribose 1-methylphosphonate 5-triphosphate diphosphatase [Bacillaceae bacterium SAS-127]
MYLMTNGRIVTETEIVEGFDLLIENDKISKILPQGEIAAVASNVEILDVAGAYISPGFIDIHSDYIEQMASPRPTSMMDFHLSIREAEKELISHGITTIFHSLSLYKHAEFVHKQIRNPENVAKFIELIDETRSNKHLIHHRFHARFEVDNIDEVDNLKKYIAEKKVHLVSFMDHTPGQGQFRDLEMYRETIKGYHAVTDEEINRDIAVQQSRETLTVEDLREIAQFAIEHNIPVASHDDDTFEKLELIKSFGTTISEFPITLDVAKRAKQLDMMTIGGAPNVLLGGSHSGNLSAQEAIQHGCIDILCSDYYPSAMLHSIFTMNKKFGIDLAELFRLVTINPAKAVFMDEERGSVAEGKKADLLIIEEIDDRFPVITTVFVDGKLIQKTNYIA